VRGQSLTTLARRLVTIPLYVGLFGGALCALPGILIITAIVDVARGTPWGATRSVLFFIWYLMCEVIGVMMSGMLWCAALITGQLGGVRYVDWHFALQWWWARMVLRGAELTLGMRFEVEGDCDVGAGPMVVFIRHASVGDTILPAVFLSGRHGLRLRYVLKRELLWDPCLDIVGNRLPNCFVRRGGADTEAEVAAIGRLAAGVRRQEGVLIYPEGTRFTEAKRARILAKLEQMGELARADQARQLRYVLPPRAGGSLALLESLPAADVVFCAHVGFDDITRFSDFLDGGLVRKTVRVAFWRVRAVDVPRDRDARLDWLFRQWKRVDDWVVERRQPGTATGARARQHPMTIDSRGA